MRNAPVFIADEAAYQKKLQVTATVNIFKPDMEVLELGCGTGSTAGIGVGLWNQQLLAMRLT